MTSALKLYETVDAIDVVREWIYEHDEEIRAAEGALPDELAELLAQAEGDFKAKAERVALFVRELLANAEAVKSEEIRLAARRRHYEKAVEGLKSYLLAQMGAADIPKIEGKLCNIVITRSPPSLKVDAAVWTQERLARRYSMEQTERDHGSELTATVRLIPERYEFDARGVIAWGTFERDGKKFYEAPLEGMTLEQGVHLRIR